MPEVITKTCITFNPISFMPIGLKVNHFCGQITFPVLCKHVDISDLPFQDS